MFGEGLNSPYIHKQGLVFFDAYIDKWFHLLQRVKENIMRDDKAYIYNLYGEWNNECKMPFDNGHTNQ